MSFHLNMEVMIANNITSYALLIYDVSDRSINISNKNMWKNNVY